MKRNLSLRIRKGAAALGVAAALSAPALGCTPMHERIRSHSSPSHTTKQQGGVEVGELEITRPAESRRSEQPSDPYGMNERMRQVASSLSGDQAAMVGQLHRQLNHGASGGVRVDASQSRAPRTASETLDQGGDCTDLAGVVIPILEQRGIPGGALIVHFNRDSQDLLHMVPYASVGGRDTIIDLQSTRLGATADGAYTIVHRLSYQQARYMYHAEMGDYQRESGDRSGAVASYRRALAIYDGDAYVHHNLGVLLEQEGDLTGARTHLQRAATLDPVRYGTEQARGSYNEELRLGYEAAEQQRWAECAQHFRNALASGESITPRERSTLEQQIGVCERNSR